MRRTEKKIRTLGGKEEEEGANGVGLQPSEEGGSIKGRKSGEEGKERLVVGDLTPPT